MDVEKSVVVKNKKYKLVAPDGGWAYMICISAIINLSTTTTFMGCFGMVYNDFFIEIGIPSTSITMVIGTFAVCTAISGFFTNALLKLMSARQLGLFAAVIYNVGIFCMVFVKSTALFFVCQGVFPGIGMGILYSLSLTSLNDYFVVKRLQAVGIVQTIIALTAMVAPMLIKWSIEMYGFRNTILLVSAISMHNILGILMMHPVEWHMKRIEIPLDSQEMQTLLLNDQEKVDATQKVPVVKLTDEEKATKIASVDKAIEDLSPDLNKNNRAIQFISSFIDISLCKTFLPSCASIGPSLAYFADSTYVLLLPQALYDMRWTQDDVAWVLSLLGFGDLAMRFMFIFFSKWIMKLGIQELYILALFVAFVARLGSLGTQNFTATLVLITIIGISRCIILIVAPLVISEVVRPEQFTSAIGMFLLTSGIINFFLAPAMGAVRDLTNSYTSVFYILTSIYAIIVLFWSIELCYKRNKHKWSTQKVNSSKSNRSNKRK